MFGVDAGLLDVALGQPVSWHSARQASRFWTNDRQSKRVGRRLGRQSFGGGRLQLRVRTLLAVLSLLQYPTLNMYMHEVKSRGLVCPIGIIFLGFLY